MTHCIIKSLPLAIVLLMTSCGGSNSNIDSTQKPTAPIDITPPSPPITDSHTPTVTLLGDSVVQLNVGDDYNEEGAQAFDQEDGDLTSTIKILGSVNTNAKGDYLLRYQATDTNGVTGETIRIIRVNIQGLTRQSYRQHDDTPANLRYIEHLPLNYSGHEEYLAPLIIFNHGSSATNSSNLLDVACCGLPAVINSSNWDNTLPFVILSPQRTSGLDTQALDEFVEYALSHYRVDPKRLYLAGWSQGANVSLRYIALYPEKVAAVIPTAGGWFQGVPTNVCDAAVVPMWSFVGSLDSSLITNTGIAAANAINNCGPEHPAKITNYSQGTHFSTSLWPFTPSESHSITEDSDELKTDIFQWLLTHNK